MFIIMILIEIIIEPCFKEKFIGYIEYYIFHAFIMMWLNVWRKYIRLGYFFILLYRFFTFL
ncbi:hypothetical protein C0J52_15692 [Blattella germanica]|nr:hypothetical protein C0J52_15692 [Blattella germanica]